jgi:hypothetical protein
VSGKHLEGAEASSNDRAAGPGAGGADAPDSPPLHEIVAPADLVPVQSAVAKAQHAALGARAAEAEARAARLSVFVTYGLGPRDSFDLHTGKITRAAAAAKGGAA